MEALKEVSSHRHARYDNSVSITAVPFDIDNLESEAVVKLFQEVKAYIRSVKIEMIASRKTFLSHEEHPAATIGMNVQTPTVLFVESLEREERVEAISHELGHLLLTYRFGLALVGIRILRKRNNEEAFRYLSNLNKSWSYLLGQIPNTIHHLILIDYLREEYGIESHRHVRFLRNHLRMIANDTMKDREVLHARGIIAFEYERLIGQLDGVIELNSQSEFFRTAYRSAREHFGEHGFSAIPAPFAYKQDILCFLEHLGYRREDFMFFPEERS